jgi:hypothetical protein
MSRRKRESVGLANESDFPHLVELAVPPGGFRSAFQAAFGGSESARQPAMRGLQSFHAHDAGSAGRASQHRRSDNRHCRGAEAAQRKLCRRHASLVRRALSCAQGS